MYCGMSSELRGLHSPSQTIQLRKPKEERYWNKVPVCRVGRAMFFFFFLPVDTSILGPLFQQANVVFCAITPAQNPEIRARCLTQTRTRKCTPLPRVPFRIVRRPCPLRRCNSCEEKPRRLNARHQVRGSSSNCTAFF